MCSVTSIISLQVANEVHILIKVHGALSTYISIPEADVMFQLIFCEG